MNRPVSDVNSFQSSAGGGLGTGFVSLSGGFGVVAAATAVVWVVVPATGGAGWVAGLRMTK